MKAEFDASIRRMMGRILGQFLVDFFAVGGRILPTPGGGLQNQREFWVIFTKFSHSLTNLELIGYSGMFKTTIFSLLDCALAYQLSNRRYLVTS
jgi:hypothetical protein